MISFHKVIILKFWKGCLKLFEGSDLNFGAVVNGYCPTTKLPLIWHLLIATNAKKRYIRRLKIHPPFISQPSTIEIICLFL